MMDPAILSRKIRSAGIAAALFLFAFSVSGQAPAEIDQLASAVRSGTVEERRDALYRLRVVATPEAARAAIPALSDPEPIVRATAAGSLGALPASEAVPALVPLLDDDEDLVRMEAALALGATESPAAEPALLRTLAEDDEREVRAAVARAIGEAGTYRSLATLDRIVIEKPKDKNRQLRASAANSIGLIALKYQPDASSSTTPESFLPLRHKTLATVTRDLTALQAAPDLPEAANVFRAATVTLKSVLTSTRESQNTRREAAFALGAIGDRKAIPLLERCSVSDDPYLAESCREALARLR